MASGHINLVESVLKASPEFEVIITAMIVVGIVFILMSIAGRGLASRSNKLVPEGYLSITNVFELISEFIVVVADSTMGKHNRKYIGFVASIFCFILFMNLWGLIPGMSMPTDNFTFNFGVAMVVFFAYNYWGVKELGLLPYLRHFAGPKLDLPVSAAVLFGVIIMAIELVSHAIRPLTLSLRLFGNMTGDHLVLGVFNELVYIVPVVFYFMGTFVCFIQAFVFAILTMIYIRFATAHDH